MGAMSAMSVDHAQPVIAECLKHPLPQGNTSRPADPAYQPFARPIPALTQFSDETNSTVIERILAANS
jgi:hypothetical protein